MEMPDKGIQHNAVRIGIEIVLIPVPEIAGLFLSERQSGVIPRKLAGQCDLLRRMEVDPGYPVGPGALPDILFATPDIVHRHDRRIVMPGRVKGILVRIGRLFVQAFDIWDLMQYGLDELLHSLNVYAAAR